jgi:hypothetical protein
MKLKITASEYKKIEEIRDAIEDNRWKEDKLVAALAKKMRLKRRKAEILWDYIYNDSYWLVEIKK